MPTYRFGCAHPAESTRGATVSPKRSDKPGPEEQAELAREEQREARDDELAAVEGEDPDQFDDDETLDEVLEIDQTELSELGLDLDDPHQPEKE
jgi:hypothetical protein